MPEIYEPVEGDPVSASQHAEVVKLARRPITGPGVSTTSEGIHIREPKSIRVITAVIVSKQSENANQEDYSFKVRRVRNAWTETSPPSLKPGEYEWDGAPFDAHSDFGYEPVDYEPYFWDVEQDGAPDLSAVFFKVRFEQGAWVVDLASGAVRPDKYVIIKAFGNDSEGQPSKTSRFLFVQEVRKRYDAEHNWTGEWALADPDEEPVEVNVWGSMEAGDYAPFIWYPEGLNEFVTLMPLRFILGDWWVIQQFKQPVSERRGPLRLVDCQPMEE